MRRLVVVSAVSAGAAAWVVLPPPTHLLPARAVGLLIDLKRAITPDRPPPAAPPDAPAVFVGDSLVRQMPGLGAANLGVNGETVDDVRARIAAVVTARPRRIVLLAGTNDLLRGAPPEAVVAGYRRLLAAIPPAIDVRVLSIPPMRHGAQRRIPPPARIAAVNRELRAIAPAFTDLHPGLAGADGRLQDRFTEDGIHLNAAGYAVIADRVRRP